MYPSIKMDHLCEGTLTTFRIPLENPQISDKFDIIHVITEGRTSYLITLNSFLRSSVRR